MKNRAFTLIELLVVVLIIGILAAIAVPQYQKAVLKSRLHTGMPLVVSLYQAQQAYLLAHGEFATDIDDLDLSVPKDENCTKEHNEKYSRYICSFGTVGLSNYIVNAGFTDPNKIIAYTYFFRDYEGSSAYFEKGSRYCFAKGTSKAALEICKNFGGEQLSYSSKGWNHFKLP